MTRIAPAIPADLGPLLDGLVALAIEAGQAILAVRGRGAASWEKADGSPLTEADLAAEAVIAAGLARLAPQLPVVSEEAAGPAAPPPGSPFLLVDPLDGTREFLGPSGEFTVNIALVVAGRPVAGVVHAPALGRIWRGAAGLGAAVATLVPRAGGESQDPRAGGATQDPRAGGATLALRATAAAPDWAPCRARPRPAGALVAVASRSHPDAETEAFLRGLAVAERQAIGSSLKFCLVAEGLADVYPRFGPTMEWDTAAGQAVLEAAGGRVTTPDGAPFAYGKAAAGFRNGPFLAWGAPG